MSAAIEIAGLIAATAMLMGGALTALTSVSVIKRLVGVIVALIAAAIATSVLGVLSTMILAAVAMSFAYCAIGVGILVRLQETYGAGDAAEIDATDDQAEPGREA